MTSFQSVFRRVFVFFLAFLFARYSPFYLCLFLFYFAFPSPYPAYFGVLSNFLVRFSQLVLRLLLLVLFFVALSLSFHPIFTQNPLSTNLNYDCFIPLTKLYLCRYFWFVSWLEIAKGWELLFNYSLTSLISRSRRGLHIIFLRGFTSTIPSEALLWCLTVCLHWSSIHEYAHFIAICRRLLAHTYGVSKLRTQTCLRTTFSLALPLRNG